MIDIYKIIENINKRKKEDGIAPCSATYSEIISTVTEQVKKEITEFCQARKMVFHKTLNSLSFDIVENNFNNKEDGTETSSGTTAADNPRPDGINGGNK